MTKSPPTPLSRSDEGKWLGGVCAGLGQGRGVSIAWIRAAFVAGALLGGLGILAYLACWLIIPQEGEQPGDPTSRGIVVLAQTCAGCVGIAMLGIAGAVATLFGFGWIVVALAAAVLVGVLVSWPRLGPGWALLPIAALIVPSIAVAASGIRLSPRTGTVVVSPRALSATAAVTYRSGLGTTLVDLRRSAWPAQGTVHLRIQGGVRRTIVALPSNRCVPVTVTYHVRPFVAQVAARLTGRAPPFSAVVVFGSVQANLSGRFSNAAPSAPPALNIDFTSVGGSLYLRDYPDTIDPDVAPDWPGYRVFLEPRPNTAGVPKRTARRIIRAWRRRLGAEVRSQRLIDSLLPGPCTRLGARR